MRTSSIVLQRGCGRYVVCPVLLAPSDGPATAGGEAEKRVEMKPEQVPSYWMRLWMKASADLRAPTQRGTPERLAQFLSRVRLPAGLVVMRRAVRESQRLLRRCRRSPSVRIAAVLPRPAPKEISPRACTARRILAPESPSSCTCRARDIRYARHSGTRPRGGRRRPVVGHLDCSRAVARADADRLDCVSGEKEIQIAMSKGSKSEDFSDVHGLSVQRFFNAQCMAYGFIRSCSRTRRPAGICRANERLSCEVKSESFERADREADRVRTSIPALEGRQSRDWPAIRRAEGAEPGPAKRNRNSVTRLRPLDAAAPALVACARAFDDANSPSSPRGIPRVKKNRLDLILLRQKARRSLLRPLPSWERAAQTLSK